MNAAKMRVIEQGLTGIAAKVLAVIPKQDWWTLAKIAGALHDRGQRSDHSVVSGCLKSLVESGLVKERPGQLFMVANNASAMSVKDIVGGTISATEISGGVIRANPEPTPTDPLVVLVDLAHKLRELATQIDDAVLALEEHRDTQAEENGKLKQLRTLLKEVL